MNPLLSQKLFQLQIRFHLCCMLKNTFNILENIDKLHGDTCFERWCASRSGTLSMYSMVNLLHLSNRNSILIGTDSWNLMSAKKHSATVFCSKNLRVRNHFSTAIGNCAFNPIALVYDGSPGKSKEMNHCKQLGFKVIIKKTPTLADVHRMPVKWSKIRKYNPLLIADMVIILNLALFVF